MARQMTETALLSEAKAARVEAEHEAQQPAALQKKKQDQQKQQQLILSIRQQQVNTAFLALLSLLGSPLLKLCSRDVRKVPMLGSIAMWFRQV